MVTFFICILIDFAARIIDGSMGIAYGVSCRTFLRASTGISAFGLSAIVHCSEVFTTLASGLSHFKQVNVDVRMALRLIIPGIIGGIVGVFSLSSIDDVVEPFICAYLIIMGIRMLHKA